MGRRPETRRIGELIGRARAGSGGALLLRGEAGMGKTTLLRYARRDASGFQVVNVSGAEFEAELAYAGLHQLGVPLDAAFDPLTATDPLRAGLATLDLLTAAARSGPLLCLVDDAHWLDAASARTMAFVARRLSAEPIAMLFAARPPAIDPSAAGLSAAGLSAAGLSAAGLSAAGLSAAGLSAAGLSAFDPSAAAGASAEAGPGLGADRDPLAELPELVLGGLTDAEARAVLDDAHRTLDAQVRDRIVAEARGNPLALLELPSAGGFGPPAPLPARIERSFRARLTGLPAGARMLLTVASADPTGDPGLLWPAVRELDVDVPAATASGLIEFGTRVRFSHTLARSAVYRAASPADRRTAHRVLAEATDPVADPDRRAWHRAQASPGPDDDIAAELERSASRARSRGGVVAAAAFLERAAALSLDPAARTERTLAAVRAGIDAGRTTTASRLLTTLGDSPEVDLLKGTIAFVRKEHSDGPRLVLRAAERTATTDPAWSRERVLDALEMALLTGRAGGVMDQVRAVVPLLRPADDTPPDLLSALLSLAGDGHRAAAPLLREALTEPLWTRRPALATMIASELWDPDLHATIVAWVVRAGRESGTPQLLRLGLAQEASLAAMAGDLVRAETAIAEEEALAEAAGLAPVHYHRLHVAAMRGRPDEELFAAAGRSDNLPGNVHWSAAVLHNGRGDYPAALTAARAAVAGGDLFLAGAALPELVEAAVRGGSPDEAGPALAALTERTATSGTATGRGVAAYAKGLVTGLERHYQEAVDLLADSPLLPYRARAHLLYGEWLRRAGRRRDSRHHLRSAHETLRDAGLEAFAGRAADELRATGERARSRSTPDDNRLTPQERSIALEVATGATSAEVAARLFLSPRTVDAHLRNIFRKLGVTSRRQLRDHPGLQD